MNNCVIVKPDALEEVSSLGIIIAQPKHKQYGEGTIMKVGNVDGISVGDKICYENPYYIPHSEVEYNGEKCHLVNIEYIMIVCTQ